MKYYYSPNELDIQHFGVKGMKWGVRRGRKSSSSSKQDTRSNNKIQNKQKIKKAIKIGAAVAGTALLSYGAYKTTKFIKDKNIEIAIKKGKEAAHDYIQSNNIKIVDFKHNGGYFEYYMYSKQRYKDKNGIVRDKMDELGSLTKPQFNYQLRRISKHNKKLYEEGNKIKKDIVDKAKKENLRTAAKNVYKYYKK